MKVHHLIKQLEGMPKNAEVVLSGRDHSYHRVAYVDKRRAEEFPDRYLVEYYNDESKSNPENEVVDVVVLS